MRGAEVSGTRCEGAGEAAQHPRFAADHEEDADPHERVDVGDRPALVAADRVDQVAVGEARRRRRRASRPIRRRRTARRGRRRSRAPPALPRGSAPARVNGSVGMCWPCSASGARPIEIPTAMMPRTRGGHHGRGEERGEQKQRTHPCEHEDEAGELVAREETQDLSHAGPPSRGYSAGGCARACRPGVGCPWVITARLISWSGLGSRSRGWSCRPPSGRASRGPAAPRSPRSRRSWGSA